MEKWGKNCICRPSERQVERFQPLRDVVLAIGVDGKDIGDPSGRKGHIGCRPGRQLSDRVFKNFPDLVASVCQPVKYTARSGFRQCREDLAVNLDQH